MLDCLYFLLCMHLPSITSLDIWYMTIILSHIIDLAVMGLAVTWIQLLATKSDHFIVSVNKDETNGFNMTSTHKNREHSYHKTIHTFVVKLSLNQHLQHHSADYSFNNFQHILHSLFKITTCSTVITTSTEGFRREVYMLQIPWQVKNVYSEHNPMLCTLS